MRKRSSPRETDSELRRVFLGLGANLGEPAAQLRSSLQKLGSELLSLEVSPLYRTEPVSSIPQPAYLNLVVTGLTSLAPGSLLAFTHGLEAEAGRVRHLRDAPRALDIDILLYAELQSGDPQLTLPHPRLRQRRFVLAPLADIAPTLAIPPDGKTPPQLLRELSATEGVERIDWPPA